MLQERLYLVEEKDGIWFFRLDQLHRAISVHPNEEAALASAMKELRNEAPCRIQVRHSGQPVSEWYIRFPDGDWLDVPLSIRPGRPRTVRPRRRNVGV